MRCEVDVAGFGDFASMSVPSGVECGECSGVACFGQICAAAAAEEQARVMVRISNAIKPE